MIGNPYQQNPYAQILQRTLGRMRGLENMGSVAPPQRPNFSSQRLGAGQPSPVRPTQLYGFNFGPNGGYGQPLQTEVTY